jgi:hypothetical protein
VDYLAERQPSLDFSSLNNLAYHLGKLFWRDLETHHPVPLENRIRLVTCGSSGIRRRVRIR